MTPFGTLASSAFVLGGALSEGCSVRWLQRCCGSAIGSNRARLTGVFELEGYWLVRRRERVPLLALADIVLAVFPLAWARHRVGSVPALERSEIGLLDLVLLAHGERQCVRRSKRCGGAPRVSALLVASPTF